MGEPWFEERRRSLRYFLDHNAPTDAHALTDQELRAFLDALSQAEERIKELWTALDRARREGGNAPHYCPGCDAATDETYFDAPNEHHPGCWLAAALQGPTVPAPMVGE